MSDMRPAPVDPTTGSPFLTEAAAAAAYQSRKGVRFAAIGDSIVGGFPETFTTIGSADAQSASGWFHRACVQSFQKMRYHGNAGVSGDTSTGVLARITDVTALTPPPDYCIVAVGENDQGNSIVAATTKTNLAAIYDALIAAGIEPVLATVMSKTTASPDLPTLSSINEFIRNYANTHGYHLLDFASFMLDPATGAPANTADGTHPNAAGYKQMCDYVVANFVPKLRLVEPPVAVVNTDTNNLLGNACMLTDTNADGVPDSWVQGTAGTSTITPSLIAAPAGSKGQFFKITATGAGTSREYKQTVSTGFAVGDALSLSGRLRTNVEAGNSSYQLSVQFTGASTFKVRLFNWSVDVDGVIYLPFVVPAGTTAIVVSLFINSAAAHQGTGDIQIGQMQLRNRTVLGLA